MGNIKLYRNYVFDLYGTLVDIHTDEMNIGLWRKLADLYRAYGAYYTPKQLRDTYLQMDREEREKIQKKTHLDYPEDQLEIVFHRMLTEWDLSRNGGLGIRPPDGWGEIVANCFRILSRNYYRLFPETLPTLTALRQSGCKLYLLSNAQAVFTRPEIRELGLEPYFERLYLSSDYGMMKPEPAFMRKLLEEEYLDPEETVMIGNEIQSDIRIADSCGVDSILININGDGKKELQQKAKKCGIRNSFVAVSSIGKIVPA